MASFEQVGRKIDKELARMHRYIKKEVQPAARREALKALRKASAQLTRAAREINARVKKIKK